MTRKFTKRWHELTPDQRSALAALTAIEHLSDLDADRERERCRALERAASGGDK